VKRERSGVRSVSGASHFFILIIFCREIFSLLENLKKHFKKSKMFILDIKGIKGFIWYFKEGKEYNLEELFVTEKGKGYGKLLTDFILKEAKKQKIKKINLDVHFKNKKAQNFFKKFGFSERTIEMSLDL